MKEVQTQLKSVAKALANLAAELEKFSDAASSAPAEETTATQKADAKKKAPAKRKTSVKAKTRVKRKETIEDKVYNVVKRSRIGASIPILRKRTQLGPRQLSNALHKLTNKGKIKTKARGIYIKA